METEKCNACKTDRARHILNFSPNNPCPGPQHIPGLSTRAPAPAPAGLGLGQIFSKQLSLAQSALHSSLTHAAPLPVLLLTPPPPSAQIIYNAFKAGPALPKPALPHPFNNVNRENRTNGSLCLVCSHVSQDLAFPVAKTNF